MRSVYACGWTYAALMELYGIHQTQNENEGEIENKKAGNLEKGGSLS